MLGLPNFAQVSFSQIPSASIEFLNPSAYAPAGELGIVVSDKQTTRPDQGDTTYRIAAWVDPVPLDPAVEFELLRNGVSLLTMDAARRIGNDTWEADWNIDNTLPPGNYVLRATLASGSLAIASTDQPITINQLAERAEIDYPRSTSSDSYPGGGQFGTFYPLARSAANARPNPMGNVDGKTSGESSGTGASRVRAFYTTSPPGSAPQWTPCGTENAPGDALLSGAANDGVRCTLDASYEQQAITAVALVANTSNRGEYQARLNGAGDVVRVLQSYAQVPTDLSLVEGAVGTVDAGVDGAFGCHSAIAQLDDQYGREIAGANIDIKALGPSDSLKFDTGLLPVSGVQAPDEGTHAHEIGYDCFGDDDETTPGDQGEHQVVGGPDVKHVEADAFGTDDTGAWGFSLRIPANDVSDSRFTTYFSAWVDEIDAGGETNDDGFTTSELCAAGAVGWGNFPANPETELALLPCQPPPLCPPAPEGTQTTAPTEGCGVEEPAAPEQSLSMHVRFANADGIFYGKLESTDIKCEPARTIVLMARHNERFTKQGTTQTDTEGRWRIRRSSTGGGIYKAVAKAGTCSRVSSPPIRLK
jgi:hypothetical protein